MGIWDLLLPRILLASPLPNLLRHRGQPIYRRRSGVDRRARFLWEMGWALDSNPPGIHYDKERMHLLDSLLPRGLFGRMVDNHCVLLHDLYPRLAVVTACAYIFWGWTSLG